MTHVTVLHAIGRAVQNPCCCCRFLVQPNIQGGIFVPLGGTTDPAGYSLPTVSAQTWPFPTVTDTGLTLLSTAVNTTSTSPTSTAG